MRQRITYIHAPDDGFTPQQLRVTRDSLSVRSLRGAKEHQLTLGLSELPPELSDILEGYNDLHIRWATANSYIAWPPFVSRVAPGLHVSFRPKDTNANTSQTLCPLLKKAFSEDLKCSTPAESFSFAQVLQSDVLSAPPLQYYAQVPSLQRFIGYLNDAVCRIFYGTSKTRCQDTLSSVASASYIDLDYDMISHVLIVSAYWDSGPNGGAWNDKIENPKGERIEVGVLNMEKADEPGEISFGGWLTVVGDDDKAKPTLFSFRSRHHTSAVNYQAQFLTPIGLHPTLAITLPSVPAPPTSSCALHAYFTLPSAVFIDRYAFSDALFLKSHNLQSLRSLTGATDLEAPDWAVTTWGSTALFELAKSNKGQQSSTSSSDLYQVTVPLHSRYMTPQHNTTHAAVVIPYPHLFWACQVGGGDGEQGKFSDNPFDRLELGYDALFHERTMFYHLQPTLQASAAGDVVSDGSAGELLLKLDIPVLDTRWSGWIENGTVLAVLLGTGWILWNLVRPLKTGDSRTNAARKTTSRPKSEDKSAKAQ